MSERAKAPWGVERRSPERLARDRADVLAKKPSAVQLRLIESAAAPEPLDGTGIAYLHSVLAQCSLPYRDPGETYKWDRNNGRAWIMLRAGDYIHPDTLLPAEAGLPFGPKARLILAHVSTEAKVTGQQEIETSATLTGFVTRALDLDPKGRNMRTVKEQIMRLAACRITLGMVESGRTVHLRSDLVSGFDVWSEREEGERVLWPRTIRLSDQYFRSLQEHAVPLSEAHLKGLSHTALGLDIYTWLAQRLHRVMPGLPTLIPWATLHSQFGEGYAEVRQFRAAFKVALNQVLAVYGKAHVEQSQRGLLLHHSQPPVPPTITYNMRKIL